MLNNTAHRFLWVISVAATMLFAACRKDWLSERSSKTLVAPSTLGDLQALLDNTFAMNTGTGGLADFAEIGTDNYYLGLTYFNNTAGNPRLFPLANAYIFSKDIFENATAVAQWVRPYYRVFNTNVVLEELEKLSDGSSPEQLKSLRASALFYRAHTFFWLAQVYAQPYDSATAASDLGIPLRIQSDINIKSTRASTKETYDKIISDLEEAAPSLPEEALTPQRPSRAAAYGLLARTFLLMRNYQKSLDYATKCLALHSTLMDFNTINTVPKFPIKQFNEEIIYQDICPTSFFTGSQQADTLLYESYADNDLRKTVFYKKNGVGHSFYGSYNGSVALWAGIATDEMILIEAECRARLLDNGGALSALNRLLEKRMSNTDYIPFASDELDITLDKIISERRKELCFRGLRWTDLRRLNAEAPYQTTVTRILDGKTYTLPPGDPRYTYPIPADVIRLTEMPQTPR